MKTDPNPRLPAGASTQPFRGADMGDMVIGGDESELPPMRTVMVDPSFLVPEPTWEPIGTAPQDGRDLTVRWGADDAAGRLVRWKQGRHFNGRRWLVGGRWTPSDDLALPLGVEPPTHWLKPPPSEDDETAEDEPVAA